MDVVLGTVVGIFCVPQQTQRYSSDRDGQSATTSLHDAKCRLAQHPQLCYLVANNKGLGQIPICQPVKQAPPAPGSTAELPGLLQPTKGVINPPDD